METWLSLEPGRSWGSHTKHLLCDTKSSDSGGRRPQDDFSSSLWSLGGAEKIDWQNKEAEESYALSSPRLVPHGYCKF